MVAVPAVAAVVAAVDEAFVVTVVAAVVVAALVLLLAAVLQNCCALLLPFIPHERSKKASFRQCSICVYSSEYIHYAFPHLEVKVPSWEVRFARAA